MTWYSVQPRDRIFSKDYGFLYFARYTEKNIIVKNISKNLNSKYSQKLLDHPKQSATDVLKTASKRVIQKSVEGTGDLIENIIADRITKFSKTSPQNNLETSEEEILRERHMSPEKRQKIINDLRLI